MEGEEFTENLHLLYLKNSNRTTHVHPKNPILIIRLMDWLEERIRPRKPKHRTFLELNFAVFWSEADTKSLRSFCVGVGIRSFSQSITHYVRICLTQDHFPIQLFSFIWTYLNFSLSDPRVLDVGNKWKANSNWQRVFLPHRPILTPVGAFFTTTAAALSPSGATWKSLSWLPTYRRGFQMTSIFVQGKESTWKHCDDRCPKGEIIYTITKLELTLITSIRINPI